MCARLQDCVSMTGDKIESLISAYGEIKKELMLNGTLKKRKYKSILEVIFNIETSLNECYANNLRLAVGV